MTITHCSHCGTANRSGSNYCNHCGAYLRAESTPPPSEPAPSEATPHTLASAAPPSDAWTGAQPWLQADDIDIDDAEPYADGPVGEPPLRRLVTHLQGLLEPVRIFSAAGEEPVVAEPNAAETAPGPPVAPRYAAEQLRRWRSLMTEEPVLLDNVPPPRLPYLPALRLLWVALLIGGLLLLSFAPPASNLPVQEVAPWPGVAETLAAIDQLPTGAPVLLLWGYDAATAGEMDLLALPLVAHLAQRQSRIMLVSLLPNGPATARRLFAQAAASDQVEPALRMAVAEQQYVESVYLPGGAALPLIGQDLAAGLNILPGVSAANVTQAVALGPALAVLLVAQAEEAQQWLEQTQPLNTLPTVAFASAAADPVLRPYWQSGQLQGLVSGFDGAWAYQSHGDLRLSDENAARIGRQRVHQAWGQVAFLVVIVLGNLAALLGRYGRG